MKSLLLALAVLASVPASAGKLKVFWRHDYKRTDGTPVELTAFRIYWGYGPDAARDQVIQLGPPALIPYKSENGYFLYAKTLDKPEWTGGETICLDMIAIADTLESAHSEVKCKVVPANPTVPGIIDLTLP